jgi:small subunit ribosomal protein S4
VQLRAKQKLKGYYGDISEKQFRKIYDEANRMKGDTPENLIGLLESRLDAVVYRAKFVPTIFAARQFVNHGHVMSTASASTSQVPTAASRAMWSRSSEKSKQLAFVLEATQLAERDVPDYIEADHNKMAATFVRVPAAGGRALRRS